MLVWVWALLAGAVAVYLPSQATASYPVVSVDLPEVGGAYIIDMGVTPQTAQNALKPYGLVYDLTVNHQIPVLWAINDSKVKDGADFTVASVNGGGPKTYRGSSFVVAEEYAGAAQPIIDTWKAANPGMVVDRATADFVVPHFETITSWPNAALDDQNGSIAVDYYRLAGIPAVAYKRADPALPYNDPQMPFPTTDRLGRCVDIFVMPHADPTWSTHRSLLDFNEDGGFIWAACHAVSVLENIADPADPDPDPDLDFLSVGGLVLYGAHSDGTPPYAYAPMGSDPVLQFIGVLDSATQNGSEQIYLPKAGGWRPTTTILVWDPDHRQVPSLSPGAAAVVAYGRGFGDPTNGLVMYEAGHEHTKGTTTDIVAAIRAFLNLHLLAGFNKGIEVEVAVPATMFTEEAVPVSVTAANGSGGYTYLWSSSCGGTFEDPTAASAVFHAPAQSGSCSLTVVVHDLCGRAAFGAETTVIRQPPPEPAVTKTPSPAWLGEPGGTVTFTVTVANPGGFPVTLTGLVDDVFGDLRDAGNPAVSANTCFSTPAAIPAGGSFACSFDAYLSGDPGGPEHVDTVTATVEDGIGQVGTGSAVATVPFTDVLPEVSVVKTPSVASVAEPGAVVTFAVEVGNPSVEPVTLASLVDSVFGDLREAANPAVANNTCPFQAAVIPAGGALSCSFDVFLSGDPGGPDHLNTVTVTAVDDEGNLASAADDAVVVFTDVLPGVSVAKSPSVASVPEPGGMVTYYVVVENLSVEDVTLVSLTDDVFGDLRFAGNAAVANNTCPLQASVIPVGGMFACSFDAFLAGDAGDPGHTNIAAAVVVDDEGNRTSGDDDAMVAFGDVVPSVSVGKVPSVGSVAEPGGVVTFTVSARNTAVEPVMLTTLTDDVFGNLLDPANPAVSANTCPSQPALLPVGGTFSCSFDAHLAGDAGDPDHVNTVTITVGDDEGNRAGDTDTARVSFGDAAPAVDVLKSAAPGSVPETGGTVTFRVEAANLSVEPVTLTSLSDSVFGDLLDPGNSLVSANTCPGQPTLIPIDGTFSCSFDAHLAGNAGGPDHRNMVVAVVADDDGNLVADADEATVGFADVLPLITVIKSPSAGSVPEPGAVVTFSVRVENGGAEAVALLALGDDVFGNLLDPSNPLVADNTCPFQPLAVAVGGDFSCSFRGVVTGGFGDADHTDVVTAVVADDEGNLAADADDARVAFADVLPALSVAKTASVGSVPEPGGTVTFSVEVANLSVEPVTVSALVDDVFGDLLDPANPLVSANSCPSQSTTLPVGGTFACAFAAFVAGDAGGPDHRNTVIAAVADDDGNLVSGRDDAVVTFDDVLPALSVAKTASVGSVPEPGGTVAFSVEVANLSVEPVTVSALVDDVFGDLLDAANPQVTASNCSSQVAVIPVGGVFACSFDASLAGDPGGPNHANTVTATVADDEGNLASDADDAVVPFSDVLPSVAVTKTPSTGAVAEPGGAVSFTVEVANTSVEAVTLVSLMDSLFGDLRFAGNPAVANNTCPFQPAVIPVAGILSCSFDALLSGDAAGPDHANTVTAVAADDEGNLASDADEAVVAFGDVTPTIDVAKQATPGSVPEPGAMVSFGVTVRNTSVEEVTLTSLDDDVFGDLLDPENPLVTANTCPAEPGTLPVGAAFSCSFEALVVGDAGDPDHIDTVTATVVDGEANSTSGSDRAAVSFSDVLPSVAVAKLPVPGTVAESGGTVTFRVEVENLSVEPVTLTSLTDDVFGDLLDRDNPLVSANTCPAQPAAIPPAGALACSFEAFVTGDAGGADHANTVTAVAADDEGNSATAVAHAVVRLADVLPSVSVTKTPSVGSIAEPGGVVSFFVQVDNTSVEPVTLTSLADSVFGDLLGPANALVSANTCPSRATILPVGGALYCSFDAFLSGDAGDPPHANTVTVSVADDEGNLASDADEAVVAFGDVAPTIDVAKRADPGRVAEPGGSVTFRLAVRNTGVETVTLISLVDDVFGDLRDPANPLVSANTCPGRVATIPVGEALTCSFVAFVAGDAGGPDHLDTVTAVVADDDSNTTSGADRARVGFDDALPSLLVTKTASPSALGEPGGIITFLVVVENTSVEEVTLTSLTDSVFGDLRDPGNMAVWENTCAARPAVIPEGGTLACWFEALVEGEFGDPDHVNTVTAAAVDDEGNPVSAADAAVVAFLETDATVSGHLFVDLDGDGGQGFGEPHLAGVRVRVVDGVGNRITITSDALGHWEAEVKAGVVSMRVVAATVPAGYRLTTANSYQTVEAPPGSTAVTSDVGYQPADGSLAGKVFFDVNGDGTQGPGEPPFAGVAVALYDGDRLLKTVLTQSDGSYRFADLAAGEYLVVVRDGAPRFAGFRVSLDPDDQLDGETGVGLATHEARVGVDYAYRGTGSIGDTIWNDADGDRVQDLSEGTIAGVGVGLVWAGFDGALGSTDDVTFPSQTTGAGGVYLFTGVPPGVVSAAVDLGTVDEGLEPTTATSFTYTLGPGEVYLDGDIGFRSPAELPNTGFDADRLGLLAVALVALGAILLLVGRRGDRHGRLRWERLR